MKKINLNWLKNIFDYDKFYYHFYNKEKKYFNFYPLENLNFERYLVSQVYATKILYLTNYLNEENAIDLKNSINSFKKNNGLIYDERLEKKSFLKRCIFTILKFDLQYLNNTYSRFAETRQSYFALDHLREPILNNLGFIKKINPFKFLDTLNWHNPWEACSQFSHLIFFNKLNKQSDNENFELFNYVINKYQNKDGFIYKDNKKIEANLKINGIMKFLTAASLDQKYLKFIKYPEKIIDFSLEKSFEEHGCDHMNIIYILKVLSQITHYKKEKIIEYFFRRLSLIKNHFWFDYSAFSFYEGYSNDQIYQAKVGKKYKNPDIHGTILFLSAISILNEVLNLDEISLKRAFL